MCQVTGKREMPMAISSVLQQLGKLPKRTYPSTVTPPPTHS